MYGGTLGQPDLLRTSFSTSPPSNIGRSGYPNSYARTVPTPLGTAGRLLAFARISTAACAPFTILSPLQLNPATGTVQRTAFPGNVIPSARFDPVAASLMQSFWEPNNPGDNITGINNFKSGFFQTYDYYNFSDRVDYNINDNWRVFGRISRYHTEDLQNDPTPNNSQLFVPTGTLRESWQYRATRSGP